MVPRVLVVAGSDSSGGAGLQADIKTVMALGGYAMTAVTALTAQNTLGVQGVQGVDPYFVAQQMDLVLEDIGADVIKTGMLYSAEIVEIVAQRCASRVRPLVVDPVMRATGGATLLQASALRSLVEKLLPLASIVTPNTEEVTAMTGFNVATEDDLGPAADRILALGPAAVLITGGHLEGPIVKDLLRTQDGDQLVLEAERLSTRSTHGTGCTLASAVAIGIAEGLTLMDSVRRAHAYVQNALLSAPGLGHGVGPLNHGAPPHVKEDRELH